MMRRLTCLFIQPHRERRCRRFWVIPRNCLSHDVITRTGIEVVCAVESSEHVPRGEQACHWTAVFGAFPHTVVAYARTDKSITNLINGIPIRYVKLF